MKTSRRNFFGKIGIAIAAMATAIVAAKHRPAKNIAVDCQENDYMLRHTSLQKAQAKILMREAGVGMIFPDEFYFTTASGGNPIRGGIEYHKDWDYPVAYWVVRGKHPQGGLWRERIPVEQCNFYAKVSGDFQNLGLIAEKMSA